MSKKILKFNSWLLVSIIAIILLLATIDTISTLSLPSKPNSWDDLGKFFITVGTVIIYILSIPLVISTIVTLRYLKGKNNYKLCILLNIIEIILNSSFIFFVICLDLFNDNSLKIILSIIFFTLLVCPFIINTIMLSKDKKMEK